MHKAFGKHLSPTELLRRNQSAINKAMREIEREKRKMEQQEHKLIAEIKKMAKTGQNESVRILARDLVRVRRYVKKFNMIQANFRAVSLQILTFKSYNTMTEAMKNITVLLRRINKSMRLPEIGRILQDFERQVDVSDLKESFVNRAIEDTFGDDDDDEESDMIVNKVLDELGLQVTDTLATLPTPVTAEEAMNLPTTSCTEEDDLVNRLNNLRKV